MLTVQPTLLIGPSDWDAERMPRAEFTRRIEALWDNNPQAERAIVFGSSAHHAELAYFTNLIPKLGPAIALLSRSGAHRMFVGDAANMLGAARPLTFIEEIASMKEASAAIAAGKAQRSLLIGADFMPLGLRASITEALAAGSADATDAVWALMRRKSNYELDAIAAAVKLTSVARKAMFDSLMSGAGVAEVVLAGERAANAAGAQDVRTLFSVDGGRTLRPFLGPTEPAAVDPLLTYLAIRRTNYWAECFPLFTTRPEPTELYESAWNAMLLARSAIKAGVATHTIGELITASVAPHQAHPMIAQAFGQRMGLALNEPPHADIGATFEEGEVYSLRVGITDEAGASMICSGMFVVQADGVMLFRE